MVFGHWGRTAIRSAFATGIALSLSVGMAGAADDATEDQILRALTPKRLTRSLSAAPADTTKAAEETKFINQIRNRTTRSLSAGEREQIASIAKEKPSIDLEITFEYNSANISRNALPAVTALGKALTNPELKGTTFVLAGHTDAVGGDAFNQDLSERRADSLKKYLMEKYGIAAADLVTVGYGEAKLKNASNPTAGENRRVQVVNMAGSKVAGH
ncbi:OmpA family protein [Bradyrhizobium sp. LHD-71]|uniref:OmpA family protein n=1 Tax=Bradyrhizobium sp. LHD-71 TaxID=3072141 RepID=UPI00280C6F92|nr:OmpA family protein [Bradyrhizobium sp. LHD-71]MDQ8727122.1 OmpA family protein [Bradyrhizobium sp. LHD-71]